MLSIYESREKTVTSIFGTNDDPQPCLNNIQINFRTGLCGKQVGILPKFLISDNVNCMLTNAELPTEEQNKEAVEDIKIEMNINIDGENVLEGLKQLTKSGYATKIHEKILDSIFFFFFFFFFVFVVWVF